VAHQAGHRQGKLEVLVQRMRQQQLLDQMAAAAAAGLEIHLLQLLMSWLEQVEADRFGHKHLILQLPDQVVAVVGP
jgi:hypothetical protein